MGTVARTGVPAGRGAEGRLDALRAGVRALLLAGTFAVAAGWGAPAGAAQVSDDDAVLAAQVEEKAVKALDEGDAQAALGLAESALRFNPGTDTWLARQVRIRALERLGRLDDAVAAAREYVALTGLLADQRRWGETALRRLEAAANAATEPTGSAASERSRAADAAGTAPSTAADRAGTTRSTADDPAAGAPAASLPVAAGGPPGQPSGEAGPAAGGPPREAAGAVGPPSTPSRDPSGPVASHPTRTDPGDSRQAPARPAPPRAAGPPPAQVASTALHLAGIGPLVAGGGMLVAFGACADDGQPATFCYGWFQPAIPLFAAGLVVEVVGAAVGKAGPGRTAGRAVSVPLPAVAWQPDPSGGASGMTFGLEGSF